MSNISDIKVGLLFSLTGTTSVTERGQYESALLAIRQINEQGGILGARLVPVTEDIASDPVLSAIKAEKLVRDHGVAAIVGLYTSACRKATIPVLEKYNTLLFYPALYEGEELSPHVVYCGPVPNQQLQHFIPWLIGNIGSAFYLIGSDYVYPRESNKHIRQLVKAHGGAIVGEHYVPLGLEKFHTALQDISKTNPHVVFSNLVGGSAIAFYQQFHQTGLRIPIASAITGETEIQAMGAQFAQGHYTSFPYFSSIQSIQNSEFRKSFMESYGTSTVSFVMESAYYSVWLLAEAIKTARSTESDAIRVALQGMEFEAPQGRIRVDDRNQHLWLHSRIGQVNGTGEFDIVWESDVLIPPLPFYHANSNHENNQDGGDVSAPIELKDAQCDYGPLIEELQDLTKYFPYQFAVFHPDGLILSVFGGEHLDLPELPPFLRTGIRVTPQLLGRSGIAMALTGRSQAVVRGMDHEHESLRQWVSIGIPIQGKSGGFHGVLGVLVQDWAVSPHAVSVLCTALKQLVESAVEALEVRSRQCAFETLLAGTINLFSEGYMAVRDGHVLVMSDLAQTILSEDATLVERVQEPLQTQTECEFRIRSGDSQHVIEVRGRMKNGIQHVFLKRIYCMQTQSTEKQRKTMKDLVGSSPAFLKNLQMAELAAQMDANVLILGESGTGKELFARAIHEGSARSDQPFIAINCAALPSDLLNAELFGYVEGAFTGAKRGGNPGKFEAANGGTLFLDEIGDMPVEQQAALLRVLQEKEVVRVGGTHPIPVNVRIISATNKRLAQEIAYNGSFRSDLYFRLNVFSVELAPLRRRKEDIPELVEHFIRQFSQTTGTPFKSIDSRAMDKLMAYSWPGNIRELRNVIERAFYLSGNAPTISLQHLPELLWTGLRADATGSLNEQDIHPDVPVLGDLQPNGQPDGVDPLGPSVHSIRLSNWQKERSEVERVLLQYKGNISRCAKALGISRSTLYRKLKEYQLM
jgi:transcriptional regulator with PAS, ATPase and Fis domain/ABC-type branched-subunit amino acid transport system substrate-binding protein